MYRLPDIEELKRLRKQLGWSQAKLARTAGVSRSLINKMELRRREPSYEKVRKIADCLQDETRRLTGNARSAQVGSICSEHLVSIDQRRTIGEAMEVMTRHRVSHLPVFDGNTPVNAITDATLVRLLRGGSSNRRRIMNESLQDHRNSLEAPYPCVDDYTSLSDVSRIIRRRGAVLIRRDGAIRGIATESDLLRHLVPDSGPARRSRPRRRNPATIGIDFSPEETEAP